MGKTIFVVDDSRTIRQQLEFTLNKAGYTTKFAENGQDALDRLKREGAVDLIILDMNMPVMGGLEMLKNMQTEAWRTIPVLVLTTQGDAERIAEARKIGAKAWMVKPFQVDVLLRAVAKLMSKD